MPNQLKTVKSNIKAVNISERRKVDIDHGPEAIIRRMASERTKWQRSEDLNIISRSEIPKARRQSYEEQPDEAAFSATNSDGYSPAYHEEDAKRFRIPPEYSDGSDQNRRQSRIFPRAFKATRRKPIAKRWKLRRVS